MKKILLGIVVVAFTAAATLVVSDILRGNDGPSSAIKIKLFSNVLQEDREAYIWLPRLYDSSRSYPVFYAVDGSSLGTPLANDLAVLFNAGVVPEGIVVGIPNMTSENRESNLVPPFMRQDHTDNNSPQGNADRFLDFIEKELIPFVEGKYSSSSRAFCGNSRGGLAVMYSFIKKPSLFDSRFCLSTPFWREDGVLIDSLRKFVSSDTSSSFFYLSVGENETENMRNGHREMTQTIEARNDVLLNSFITPRAIHGDNALISIPDGLVKWGEYVKGRK
ncbi:MAG: alpha/beta hydrolase-fold protein [Bacteroidota bacterium]